MARPSRHVKYVKDATYQRILDASWSKNRVEWALIFATGHLGMRVGETVLITGRDFDFERQVATVPTLKQRGGLERYPVYFSGAGGRIAEKMREAVDAALAGRPTSSRLWPRTTRWCQKVWHRYIDETGWRDLGIHALRHWFGVATYRDTRNIVLTQQQLRHSSINSTMVYVALVDAEEQSKKFQGIQA